jgi:hypothetical protein
MDYCFDTSAINRLHDDSEHEAVVLGLLAGNRLLISEWNLIEVIGTANVQRRLSLCRLLKRLTRENMPLLDPTRLLRKLTTAYLNNEEEVSITSDRDNPEAWYLLQHPERCADEEMRQGFYEEKRLMEDGFTKAHQVGRTQFPDLFRPEQLPRNFGQTLQFFCREPLTFHATVAATYEGITNRTLSLDEMRQLFIDLPEWPLYFGGWAQGLYARALQDQSYGARSNAGAIDLLFALYLEHCDFLVTDDFRQYQALRILKCLARGRHPRVILYDQLRRRLVL